MLLFSAIPAIPPIICQLSNFGVEDGFEDESYQPTNTDSEAAKELIAQENQKALEEVNEELDNRKTIQTIGAAQKETDSAKDTAQSNAGSSSTESKSTNDGIAALADKVPSGILNLLPGDSKTEQFYWFAGIMVLLIFFVLRK